MIAVAENLKTVSGEYTFYAPETMPLSEARRAALQQARIVALSNEFGTIVNQSNATAIHNTNGEGDTRFQSLSSSDVRGIWIEDIGTPEFIIEPGEHLTAVHCKVKGKAKEILGVPIQYEVMTLRNGRSKKFQSIDFHNEDELYLYFRSPVDGYLMVFLLDEASQTVYSILPYKRDCNSSFHIARDKEYILFSIEDADPSTRQIVDEYQLTCDDEKEYNTLYIIFSPHKIYKSADYFSSEIDLPESTSFINFRTRLGNLIANNMDIQFSQVSLSVSR